MMQEPVKNAMIGSAHHFVQSAMTIRMAGGSTTGPDGRTQMGAGTTMNGDTGYYGTASACWLMLGSLR